MGQIDFAEWQEKVIRIITEKQKRIFANFKKNKWKVNGRVFKNMHKEGLSPNTAANLWALAHEK